MRGMRNAKIATLLCQKKVGGMPVAPNSRTTCCALPSRAKCHCLPHLRISHGAKYKKDMAPVRFTKPSSRLPWGPKNPEKKEEEKEEETTKTERSKELSDGATKKFKMKPKKTIYGGAGKRLEHAANRKLLGSEYS